MASSEPTAQLRKFDGLNAVETFGDGPVANLAVAACGGDDRGIHNAVGAGADPNFKIKRVEEMTPLLWALLCDSAAGVEVLLDVGADPNLPLDGCSAVCVAAGQSSVEILEALLRRSGDPNARYSDSDWTALKMAFSTGLHGGNWSKYYALLDAGADINQVYMGDTIALWAAGLNQYDKVEELLDRGYRVALDYLGRMSQSEMFPGLRSPQEAYRVRVIDKLKRLGVAFPVTAFERP